MKKSLFIFSIVLFALCSCQKTPVQNFCGSYSFKTGGHLELLGKVFDMENPLVLKDTVFTRSLLPENGQLRIVEASGDRVKLTMNVFVGSPVVFDGTVNGNSITLEPIERRVVIYRDTELVDLFDEVLLKVWGTGEKYGNSLIINLEYGGSFRLGLVPCTVKSSNVKCVAVENE